MVSSFCALRCTTQHHIAGYATRTQTQKHKIDLARNDTSYETNTHPERERQADLHLRGEVDLNDAHQRTVAVARLATAHTEIKTATFRAYKRTSKKNTAKQGRCKGKETNYGIKHTQKTEERPKPESKNKRTNELEA